MWSVPLEVHRERPEVPLEKPLEVKFTLCEFSFCDAFVCWQLPVSQPGGIDPVKILNSLLLDNF